MSATTNRRMTAATPVSGEAFTGVSQCELERALRLASEVDKLTALAGKFRDDTNAAIDARVASGQPIEPGKYRWDAQARKVIG